MAKWTRSSYEAHPEGVFKAQFTDWKEENHEQYGEQVKLIFQTEELDATGKNRQVSCFTKPSLHEKGKVAKMLKAFGVDAEDLDCESFDLDDYVGQKLQLVIENTTKEGTVRDKIANFLPLRKGKPQAQPEPEKELVGAAAGSGKNGKPNWGDDDE